MAKKAARKGAAKRELIDTGTDKRYVRRNPKGQFKESDDVGRSLSADRRQRAKRKAKRGQGDKGTRATGSLPPCSRCVAKALAPGARRSFQPTPDSSLALGGEGWNLLAAEVAHSPPARVAESGISRNSAPARNHTFMRGFWSSVPQRSVRTLGLVRSTLRRADRLPSRQLRLLGHRHRICIVRYPV